MNDSLPSELDPLSNYDYQNLNYNNYGISALHHNYHPPVGPYYPKTDQSSYMTTENSTNQIPDISVNYHKQDYQGTEATVSDDKKLFNEDIKPTIDLKWKKIKGKKSTYWNAKIDDKNFEFFGCSICNISYKDLVELDNHITDNHSNERISSYDLRKRNQIKNKGKKKRKGKKKTKKGKGDYLIDIEIKPEDGYIGEAKAEEYDENGSSFNNNDQKEVTSEGVEGTSGDIEGTSGDVEGTSGDVEGTQVVKEDESKPAKQKDVREDKFEKIYKCFACNKQFALSYYIRLHVRSHTGEKPYTCSTCGETFITASKLGRHNKRVHLTFKHQCRICFRVFSRLELLKQHFDKRHLADKLEGEVYDYYAILPYLKEIEETLKMKAEDTKPKKEDLWLDIPEKTENEEAPMIVNLGVAEIKIEVEKTEDKVEKVIVEEVKVMIEEDTDVRVKEEAFSDSEVNCDNGLVGFGDHFGDGNNASDKEASEKDDEKDEDYFPINTCAVLLETEPSTLNPQGPDKTETPIRNKNGTLTCPYCQKNIKSVTYMKIHLRTHTGEKPFKCYLCGRGFITSSKMHRHVLTHSESWEEGDGKIKIENEDENDGEARKKARAKFTKKPAKVTKRKGDGKRKHSCSFCHKRFLHYETLQVHAKSHEGEIVRHRCNFCLEEMSNKEELAEHEKCHIPPKPFLCTLCGKTYTKRETMVYHRKQHQPDEDQLRFTCDICNRSFNAKTKLERHLTSHSIPKYIYKYECPVCAHMFNTKYHIQMHLVTHQKEGLIVEENRNEILAMVLQNARKIPKQPEATMPPLQSAPGDERSRICNICGEVFSHFYYLEEHLKSHGSTITILHEDKEEVKKHICQICNKGFKLPYYLKLHNYIHTKEKPYTCQQCGKGFITKGKLKRHIETHSGLKKFQCHICYKFFTRPSYLRIHVRTIHGTQDYNFRVEKNYDYDNGPVVSGEQYDNGPAVSGEQYGNEPAVSGEQ